MQFQIIDAKGLPVGKPCKTGREALEAKRVYQDHSEDIELPMKVVPVDEVEAERKREVAA